MNYFFRDNKRYIIVYSLAVFITLIYLYTVYDVRIDDILYIIFLNIFILGVFLTVQYAYDKKMYNFFEKNKKAMSDFIQDLGESNIPKQVSETLKQQYELYMSELEKEKNKYDTHINFIYEWVHQMKTPLSVLKLKGENIKKQKALNTNIDDEISKLDRGLSLAMNYARLDSFNNDFIITKINLKKVVTEAVNNEKQIFIMNNVFPKVCIDDSISITSDYKWFLFLLDQIIVNGVKYSKGVGNKLDLYVKNQEKFIVLVIKDYGIGIEKCDIDRIFEPFFTGSNGRKFGESTGMGLFVAKRICKELNHQINIKSEKNNGVEAEIIIKKSDFYEM